MHRTYCLIILAVFRKVESTPDLVAVACSRRPNLPFCNEDIKMNAYREVLYNRLKTLKTWIPDGYVEWPSDESPVSANQQYATRNEFTTPEQRKTGRNPMTHSDDKLATSTPLRALAAEQMEVMSRSQLQDRKLNPKTGHTSAETMDSKKLQARKNRNRNIQESEKGSSPRLDRRGRGLVRTLRAINSLTADPMTFSTERAMDRPSRADQALKAEPSDAVAEEKLDTFQAISSLSDSHGVHHRPRSRSPFVKPGLWEPNPDNPHNRDHANKWYYHPYSVGADWLGGQASWGSHWAVPAAGVGGTDEYSEIHFPSLGTVLNIPDDYD